MAGKRGRTVAYRGPSMLDGRPIMLVVSGYVRPSENRKTGAMVQTWVIPDNGSSPLESWLSGDDVSVCGDCPFRSPVSGGDGVCYVDLGRGPNSTYRAVARGNVDEFDPELWRGKRVRVGAYGDPAAVPFEVWEQILSTAAGHTGYTHQWRSALAAKFRGVLMASCDTLEDYRRARAEGWRGFVVGGREDTKPRGLVHCPSDATGGRVQCVTCMQCDGADGRSASIFIPAHGSTAGRKASLGESEVV